MTALRRPKRFYRHMNPVIAQMIRQLYFTRRMNQPQLAAFFRIKQNSVSRIVSGQVW